MPGRHHPAATRAARLVSVAPRRRRVLHEDFQYTSGRANGASTDSTQRWRSAATISQSGRTAMRATGCSSATPTRTGSSMMSCEPSPYGCGCTRIATPSGLRCMCERLTSDGQSCLYPVPSGRTVKRTNEPGGRRQPGGSTPSATVGQGGAPGVRMAGPSFSSVTPSDAGPTRTFHV